MVRGPCSGSPVAIHLGSPSPVTSCGSPGTNQRAVAFLLSLAPGGVYRAAPVTRGAGGLLHPRFTLACASCEGHRRSVLCGTFRRVAPPGRYPAPCPVESGLSSSAGKSPHARGHPASSFFCHMLCPCCHGRPPVCQLGVRECLQGGGHRGRAGVNGGRPTSRSGRRGPLPGLSLTALGGLWCLPLHWRPA